MFIIISYGSYKISLFFSVVFQASTGKKNLTGTGNLMLQIQFIIYMYFLRMTKTQNQENPAA